jgi:hypothetical protein
MGFFFKDFFSPTISRHLAHKSSSAGATYLQQRGHFASFGGRTQAVPFPPGTSNLAEKLHSLSGKTLPAAFSRATDETTNIASRSSLYFSNILFDCSGKVSMTDDWSEDFINFWVRPSSCARFMAILAFKSQGMSSSMLA